jgi:hypothetical protein
VILDEAEALLDPVSDIDGFMLACLVDASTGMVLASREDPEPQILLLVILDRSRVNLAMARREIRNFCASFAA